MKTTTAFYLLLIYLLAMCKPVLPLVQDEIAHLFWKAEHIGTVHHHHGDHHAEEEVADAAHEEENDNSPSSLKTSEPVSVHNVLHSLCNIPHLSTKKLRFVTSVSNISSTWLDKHYPPPKSS